jgi:uncharacterized coiled-coil DUF342 family protein
MNNDKYVNYYVEYLGNKLNETILRNISLQATAKVVDDLIGELNQENDLLKKRIEDLTVEVLKIRSGVDESLSKKDKELEELRKSKTQYDLVKHQVNHLDTFRNQLLSTENLLIEKDKEIDMLKKKIDALENPPNKRKKIAPPKIVIETETTIKDGGTF